jgi:alcohol dehydrogenase (NADP+)
MLDFCAEHRIGAEVETVRPDGIDAALERLGRGDVRFRFSVDLT